MTNPLIQLSVIVPVLNEAAILGDHLSRLQDMRARGHEVIVVDGGSTDDSGALASDLADLVLQGPRGRAAQMNLGASRARGAILLFLHADTRLPENADARVIRALSIGAGWGRFDVTLAGRHRLLPMVAACMNLRSRLTGIATGDQAIFVSADWFRELGGFPQIALMEDIAISRHLRARQWPVCLSERVCTSGRRWDQGGLLHTVITMWFLRLAYFFGADPVWLARCYGHVRR